MHCIVSGGGLTYDKKIRRSKNKFFIPVGVLRDKFKGKYLSQLDSMYRKGQIVLSSSCEKLRNSYEWKAFKNNPVSYTHLDYPKNYGIWKSEKVRSRKKLQELQKKTLSFIEIIGALFLTATIFFRVQMHQKVPEWCTIVCLCVVLGAVVLNLVISRKLRKIEDL